MPERRLSYLSKPKRLNKPDFSGPQWYVEARVPRRSAPVWTAYFRTQRAAKRFAAGLPIVPIDTVFHGDHQ